MRLNPDCIRDILLAVEETSEFGETRQYNTACHQRLSKYSEAEFLYHVNQCNAIGFFIGCRISPLGDLVMIRDLSPKAHEFLANIRNDNNYKNIVEIAAKKIGSTALSVIQQVASIYIQKKIEHL